MTSTRKVTRYKNTTKTKYVEKGGVTYRVVEMSGMKIMIKATDKEIKQSKTMSQIQARPNGYSGEEHRDTRSNSPIKKWG